MPRLHAGLVIPRASGGAPDLVEAVKLAESRGVERVWTTVGGATADPVTSYAAAAAMTERVVLGTSVTPTYPRHPITLASQAIALDELAPGRIRLGIGTSHQPTIEGVYGIPMGRPLAHLREYLTILRSLLWTGDVDFQGEYYQVQVSLPQGSRITRIPIPISALRKNAFSLAGELADGAITWVTPIHYIANTAIPALQAGADKAGRTRPPLIAHVPVALSTDRDASRNAFRAQFSIYPKLPFYAAMFADAGFPVTSEQTMTDELVDDLLASGNAATVRSRLAHIREQGIDELLISHVIVKDAASELESLSEIIADFARP